jgi:poly(3-hydroxyalkanoate) synthetase
MVGRNDDIVPEHQILAITKSVSTPKDQIAVLHADCGHLALFLGRKTLQEQWPDIAHWLACEKGLKAVK